MLTTKCLNDTQNRKVVKIKMNNTEIKLQLDTGSDITIINIKTLKNIVEPTLSKTKVVARGKNVSCANKTLKTKAFLVKIIR